MWTSTFYGGYDYWLLYHKVTFDGVNKLILVNPGETELDVQIDIYSDWKEWMGIRDNSKYPLCISTVGGEPIGGGQSVGQTYFLENGWRIRSWEGNHTLLTNGNLFTREAGQFPFISTLGNYSVNYIMARSQLVQAITVESVSTGSNVNAQEIAEAVWKYALSGSVADGTFGNHVGTKLLTLAQYMSTK